MCYKLVSLRYILYWWQRESEKNTRATTNFHPSFFIIVLRQPLFCLCTVHCKGSCWFIKKWTQMLFANHRVQCNECYEQEVLWSQTTRNLTYKVGKSSALSDRAYLFIGECWHQALYLNEDEWSATHWNYMNRAFRLRALLIK